MTSQDYVPKFEHTMSEHDSLTVSELDFEITSQDLANILPQLPQLPQFQVSEETMNVTAKYPQAWHPVSPRGRPPRDISAGILNFTVEISGNDTHKNKYLYSSKLNRIYVDMMVEFAVQFSWDYAQAPGNMYVRATTVFSDEAQAEKRVERCVQHIHEKRQSDIPDVILQNVLHSARELQNTEGVYYCGNPDQADSWYSVVVYFPSDAQLRHAYKFVCKNSCSNGINRRFIEIIFTLEDMHGDVYGRQSVGARVCSCPRRDLIRDEKELEKTGGRPGKRRVAVNRQEPKVKRVKSETSQGDDDDDELLITLPPISIIGIRPAITGLEVMRNMMELVAPLKSPELQVQYQQSIDAIKDKIEEIRNINTGAQVQ